MTEAKLKAKFLDACRELHAAGWDVLAAVSKRGDRGTESHQRVLLHGRDEAERAKAFFRCNREFKDELTHAACFVPISPPAFLGRVEEDYFSPPTEAGVDVTRDDGLWLNEVDDASS